MKVYETKDIRNVALLGHAGSGKTLLADTLLFKAGAINRRGSVEDRNTVSDYHEIEHERGNSIYTTPVVAEYKNVKLNILDAPGFDDFVGQTISAIRAAETALIVINSTNAHEVGVELATTNADKDNSPMVFAINRLDVENAKFDDRTGELQDQFGKKAAIVQFPVNPGVGFNSIIDLIKMKMYSYDGNGTQTEAEIPANLQSKAEGLRSELIESIAETNDDLMNKYFEEGELPDEDILKGLKQGISTRQLFPIFAVSGKSMVGIDLLLENILNFFPAPNETEKIKNFSGDPIKVDAAGPVGIFIYGNFSDPRIGDLAYFKVLSGKVESGMDFINATNSQSERLGQVFAANGKNRLEVESMVAGDIGLTVKLKTAHINDTLHLKGKEVKAAPMKYPNPKVRTAVVPVKKGEEEKVGMGLNALHSEDPTYVIEHSQELRQIILKAQGELHLGVAKHRLENRYKVEAKYIEPRVPYRETIQKQSKGSYRHKKQSGGAGQFAEVHMMLEPWYEGLPYASEYPVRGKDMIDLAWGGKLEFVNSIVGGVIDQRFMPAILKGVMEKMEIGPLTGSYVRDIRVTIFDGKMHPVDSNETAFKIAGTMVFKENFVKSDPKVLEPIYIVEIKVPDDFVGDVMSDLPSRRGVILGIETEGRYQKIKARMPLAEVDKYSTALRSMTQARATFSSEFAEYQQTPPNIQVDLVEAYKKQNAEEE